MRIRHQRPLPLPPSVPPEHLLLRHGMLRWDEAVALKALLSARKAAEKAAVQYRRNAPASALPHLLGRPPVRSSKSPD